MKQLTERMIDVADDLRHGRHLNMVELELLLRESAYRLNKCCSILAVMTELMREDEKKKGTGG